MTEVMPPIVKLDYEHVVAEKKRLSKVRKGLVFADFPTDAATIRRAIELLVVSGIDPGVTKGYGGKTVLGNFFAEHRGQIDQSTYSAPKKVMDLCILAVAVGLAVAPRGEADYEQYAEEIEAFIRNAAPNLTEPSSSYARVVADEFVITFGKDVLDCFGWWERGNDCCQGCPLERNCVAKVRESNLAAMANPAISIFRIKSEKQRPSTPMQILPTETVENAVTRAEIDRNSFISFIDVTYPDLIKTTYAAAICYHISNQHMKRKVLIKIETFSPRSYSVLFSKIADDLGSALELVHLKAGWTYSSSDLARLKETVIDYLAVALDMGAISGELSEDENIKLELMRSLEADYRLRLDYRRGYEVLNDSRGHVVLRFKKFSDKSYHVAFPRMRPEQGESYGLKHTSHGYAYLDRDLARLKQIIKEHLDSIKGFLI